MIKLENLSVNGWEAAIRGMRNPKNSWDKSDSIDLGDEYFLIGSRDFKLMRTLANAGEDHGKFLRMINVSLDITAPLYWWKEFDTYKVGTVANSCSTMHRIHEKEFTLDDFSHEHLFNDGYIVHGDDCYKPAMDCLREQIHVLNMFREKYLETKDKDYWWQMIQLLPTSYNQRRTVSLNYAVLRNMYNARKNHKLDEWRFFCDWLKENLPYSELITGEPYSEDEV